MLSTLRYLPLVLITLLSLVGFIFAYWVSVHWLWLAIPLAALTCLGIFDLFHPSSNLLRIYPLMAYGRFISEELRPEIHQYFVESDTDGTPLSYNTRRMIYERSERAHQEKSFGTELEVYAPGYEWLNHSMAPKEAREEQFRATVGGKSCKHPYEMSLLNVSSMSFGSLSANAVLALNGGAKLGDFAHATGEGGLSQYHLEPGGDLIW